MEDSGFRTSATSHSESSGLPAAPTSSSPPRTSCLRFRRFSVVTSAGPLNPRHHYPCPLAPFGTPHSALLRPLPALVPLMSKIKIRKHSTPLPNPASIDIVRLNLRDF